MFDLCKKEDLPIVLTAIISIIAFTIGFLIQGNYEFIGYIVIMLLFFTLVLVSHKKVQFSKSVLWMLVIWAILHMAGGGIKIGGEVLYAKMLIPIIGEPYNLIKYDQPVHAFGFFVATLTMWEVLRRHLKNPQITFGIGLTIVMVGAGLGALNEIVEFASTIIVPGNGVGGYVNNAIDNVMNFIGAIAALILIKVKEK